MERSIHHLPVEERPRERLQLFGPEALSDQDLLAILLGSGTSRCPVTELAANLIGHAMNLSQLAQQPFEQLCAVKGIGPAKATILLAACELGRRALLPEAPKVQIRSEEDALQHFRHCFQDKAETKYLLVLLDRQKCLLATAELPHNKIPPDLQNLLSIATEAGAHGFGLLRQQRQDESDYKVTEKQWLEDLRAAANILRIKFYSRLIVPT